MPVNKVFKTRMRMERAIRMEVAGYSDADISMAIHLTPQGYAQMKLSDEYKQLRLQISSGVLAELDAAVGEETEELRNRIRSQVPLALQAIADCVTQKQDSKLRLQAATELLDRDGRFMKASRSVTNTQDDLPSYMTGKDDEQVARILQSQVVPTQSKTKTEKGETIQ